MSPAEQLQDLLAHADDPRPPDPEEPLRFSRLKLFSKSAAHFVGQPPGDSSSMDIGSAAHSMLLGGQRVVGYLPGKKRQGKEFDQFEKDNAGAIVLTASEYRRADAMARAVRDNPLAMRVLDGVRETTYTWRVQKRLCRGTPDVRGNDFITELKTGETADPRFFPYKMRRFCYHGQLAWYTDGATLAGLPTPEQHYIVAVEAAPPFVVTVFRVSPSAIDIGRRLYRLWFEQLEACAAADAWPGYCQSVVELDLPGEGFEIEDAGEEAA